MSTPQAPSSQGAPVAVTASSKEASSQGAPVAVTASSKEAQVILPPPSATNPVPTLPAALRLDNQEQLLNLLQMEQGRQLLIFETDELRTLLLRQVVSDPNTRVYKGRLCRSSPEYSRNPNHARQTPKVARGNGGRRDYLLFTCLIPFENVTPPRQDSISFHHYYDTASRRLFTATHRHTPENVE